jgi:hypothetical protein
LVVVCLYLTYAPTVPDGPDWGTALGDTRCWARRGARQGDILVDWLS